ncbi:hypothetical protein DB43_AS00150 [Parachlamydia acanthamoebae]|nr:hypothetical protein DB43_AS00150 [Parachlamydia acanthamoebae]
MENEFIAVIKSIPASYDLFKSMTFNKGRFSLLIVHSFCENAAIEPLHFFEEVVCL